MKIICMLYLYLQEFSTFLMELMTGHALDLAGMLDLCAIGRVWEV